jgi:predicted ester cyclase
VISDFRTSFPDVKVTVHEITFQGDRSFAQWTVEGTNTGPGDFPPTGRPIKFDGSSFGRYADGKLVEELVYFDALDMMTQLGLIPDPSA